MLVCCVLDFANTRFCDDCGYNSPSRCDLTPARYHGTLCWIRTDLTTVLGSKTREGFTDLLRHNSQTLSISSFIPHYAKTLHPMCFCFTASSNLARSSPPTAWQRRGFGQCTAYHQQRHGPGKVLLPSQTFPRARRSCSPTRSRDPRDNGTHWYVLTARMVYVVDHSPQRDIRAFPLPH